MVAEAAKSAGVREDALVPRDPLGKIVTIPNVLTLVRIALVASFAILLLGTDQRIAAVVMLMAAGITDFLDGYIARHFSQVSTLGKILDPVADRITLITAILVGVVYGAIAPWIAAIVLGREVLVSGAVIVLAILGAARVEVTWLGKASTFGLYLSLPLFVLGDGAGQFDLICHVVAYVLALPAMLGSIVAAVAYVPLARQAFHEGRKSLLEERGAVTSRQLGKGAR